MLDVPFRSFFSQASKKIILKEQAEGVLTHLTHLEELILTSKKRGLEIALQFLKELHDVFKGKTDSTTFTTVKFDGCIDSNTLIVTDRGPQTIETIINRFKAGETILVCGFNFDENVNILTPVANAVKKNGTKQWIELELENGDVFKCTEDHEIYTENRGWVQAKDLTLHDVLKILP